MLTTPPLTNGTVATVYYQSRGRETQFSSKGIGYSAPSPATSVSILTVST